MKLIFILSFISVFTFLEVEKPNENKSVSKIVLWEKNKKLTWDDFKGFPKSGSPYSAECNWEINYSYSYNPYKNKKLEFEVNCYFNSLKSWVRSAHKTNGLLEHEQVHFDIAELCTRRLRKKLIESEFNKATFKEELNTVFKQTLVECDSIQNAYDEQTNHGLIKSKQAEWLRDTHSKIVELENFDANQNEIINPFQEQNLITKLFNKLNIF